jgi:hypothetical protein
LLARLGNEADSGAGITPARLWHVMRRFFNQAAGLIEADHSPLAEKLRRASPHWMRHYVPFRIMSCNRVMARFSGQAGDVG